MSRRIIDDSKQLREVWIRRSATAPELVCRDGKLLIGVFSIKNDGILDSNRRGEACLTVEMGMIIVASNTIAMHRTLCSVASIVNPVIQRFWAILSGTAGILRTISP